MKLRLFTFITYLVLIFLQISGRKAFADGHLVSWPGLKKTAADYYKIPPHRFATDQEAVEYTHRQIDDYAARLPKFDAAVNSVDKDKKIKDLMKGTAHVGFPTFGERDSLINRTFPEKSC
jgi:hypothetical protein